MIIYTVARICYNGTHAIEYDSERRPMSYANSEDAELNIARLREYRPGEKYIIITHRVQ